MAPSTLVLVLLAAVAATINAADTSPFDLLKEAGRNKMISLFTKIGYDSYLSSSSAKVTIFAPADSVLGNIDDTNVTEIKRVLSFHMSYGQISSSQFEAEAEFRTSLGQNIKVKSASENQVIITDILGGSDISFAPAKGLSSDKATVYAVAGILTPYPVGAYGTPCKEEIGPCRTSSLNCSLYAAYFDSDCSPSKLMMWQGQQCCLEPCYRYFRKNGGTGEVCTRHTITRTTGAPIITKPSLPKCPESCKAAMTSCLSKGYEKKTCLSYFAQGLLCKPEGTRFDCNAENLLPEQPECPDSTMIFKVCGGCQRTCADPNPPCTKMCHEGCFCPSANQYFDDTTKKCVTQCPAALECETTIAADYLDTGNAAAKCSRNQVEGTCSTTCEEKECVNIKGYDNYASYCARYANKKDCAAQRICEWPNDKSNSTHGPIFSCVLVDDKDTRATWTILEEGNCAAGTTVYDTVCTYFKETNCRKGNQFTCTGDKKSMCSKVATNTFKECSVKCFGVDLKLKDCRTCIEDSLFESNTIDEEEPDLISCCPCLDDVFVDLGIDQNDLDLIFDAPCKEHGVQTDDDDNFYGYYEYDRK